MGGPGGPCLVAAGCSQGWSQVWSQGWSQGWSLQSLQAAMPGGAIKAQIQRKGFEEGELGAELRRPRRRVKTKTVKR